MAILHARFNQVSHEGNKGAAEIAANLALARMIDKRDDVISVGPTEYSYANGAHQFTRELNVKDAA